MLAVVIYLLISYKGIILLIIIMCIFYFRKIKVIESFLRVD